MAPRSSIVALAANILLDRHVFYANDETISSSNHGTGYDQDQNDDQLQRDCQEYFWGKTNSLPVRLDHCWSWDALRSILRMARPLDYDGPQEYLSLSSTSKVDLVLGTETELLSGVISIVINDMSPQIESHFMPDVMSINLHKRWRQWGEELWSWLLARQHHQLLLALLNGRRDGSNEAITAFARCFIMILANTPPIFWRSKFPHDDIKSTARNVLIALQKVDRGLTESELHMLLHQAISWKDADLVQALVQGGADCNREASCGMGRNGHIWESPLHRALTLKQASIVATLLRSGAKSSAISPIIEANDETANWHKDLLGKILAPTATCYDMDMEITRSIYESNPTSFSYTEFCLICCPSLCKSFLISTEEPQDDKLILILFAVVEGHSLPSTTPMMIIELALFGAVEFGNIELARRILKCGGNPEIPAAKYYVRDQLCSLENTDHEPNVPLEHAIRNADFAMVKLLLDTGARLTEDMLKHLPLIDDEDNIAFLREIVQFLDKPLIHIGGLLQLLLAIHDDDQEKANTLTKTGVDINGHIIQRHWIRGGALKEFIVTPLLYALKHCNHDLVEFLWSRTARLLTQPPYSRALELCVICQSPVPDMLEKLEFILRKGAWPGGSCWILTDDCSATYRTNQYDPHFYLTDSVDLTERTPLQWLLWVLPSWEEGEPGRKMSTERELQLAQAVKILLNYGANVDPGPFHGATPLQLACRGNSYTIARLLLEAGADANLAYKSRRLMPPLEYTARADNMALALLLVEHGARPTSDAFVWIADRGRPAMTRFLAANGLDVDTATFGGATALVQASRFGSLPSVELLVKLGADVNLGSREKPLQSACQRWDSRPFVELLLNHGADVNAAPGQRGYTALQEAVKNSPMETVLLLLEAGADVDAYSGKADPLLQRPVTAIERAAREGRLDMVKVLINAGAESKVKGKKFTEALQLARNRRHFHVVRLLREHSSI